jgi:hypothetical protein
VLVMFFDRLFKLIINIFLEEWPGILMCGIPTIISVSVKTRIVQELKKYVAEYGGLVGPTMSYYNGSGSTPPAAPEVNNSQKCTITWYDVLKPLEWMRDVKGARASDVIARWTELRDGCPTFGRWAMSYLSRGNLPAENYPVNYPTTTALGQFLAQV